MTTQPHKSGNHETCQRAAARIVTSLNDAYAIEVCYKGNQGRLFYGASLFSMFENAENQQQTAHTGAEATSAHRF
jgi:hypothetical protein